MASAWEADCSDKLVGLGTVKGVANPTVFYNQDKQMRCVVHGDFTFLGWEEDLVEMAECMRES